MDYIPYGRQYIDEDDIQSVVDVLRSDWITTGPKIAEFEEKFAELTGAKYAVAVNSGTAALHAAYFAAGVGPGDEVVTSPITFAATANAALYLGARPVFADVTPDTINIDPKKIAEAITQRTKVIAPVDFAGHPAKLDEIITIARENGLVVVEDAAHALGAVYRGKPVGSVSDMTVFSFHPVKHITTGEGGAVVTNNEEYYRKLLCFRSHGIIKDKRQIETEGPWYSEMRFLGYNYRLTDFQCALGISQLKKLDFFLERRKVIARTYFDCLESFSQTQLPVVHLEVDPSWHIFPIRLGGQDPPRREIFELLHQRGIRVQVHYIPVYMHPFYRRLGFRPGLCPQAEDYYKRCLTLPLFPSMRDQDVRRVVAEIRSVLSEVYG